MKIRVRWLLSVFAAVIAILVIGVYAFLHAPLFGRLPDGERLSRIERSPNYAGGEFHNQIDTPLHTAGSTELSIWMDNFFGEKGKPRPSSPMPSVKTDLKALEVNQDLVVWLGHSSYFVQLAGKRILIDPVFSTNAAPIPLANVAFEGSSLYSAEDVPQVDLLLITHDHYDHLDFPTITALRSKVNQVVTGLGVGAHFEAWGYAKAQVSEADWYDSVSVGRDLTLYVTPARHFSGRTFTRDKSLWVGYALVSAQRRIFFSGDSGYDAHFSEVGRRYGPFDWVALDTGQYDPRWANVHMNPEQAAQAADDLRTKAFTLGHVGRFSIAPHDWDDPFKRVTVASEGRDYVLWTPIIGRPLYLDGRPQTFERWWETLK